MTNRILVPVDGSEPSDDALEFALDRFPEATVTVVYVVDPMVDYSRRRAYPGYAGPGEFATEVEKGESVLEEVTDRYGGSGAHLETEIVMGRPARAIVEFAEANEVDGIVLGSHGCDGTARVLLGSVAEAVVRRAPVPVTVVR
jgi:nucleotide-binding universal stress UspA family protein